MLVEGLFSFQAFPNIISNTNQLCYTSSRRQSSNVQPFFLLFTDGQMYRGEREASAAMNSASPYDFYGKPFYGKTTIDVIVQEGSHAFFHCLVHNLGNQTVSNHANCTCLEYVFILQKILVFLSFLST